MKHLHLPLIVSLTTLPVAALAHTGTEAHHGEEGALAYWVHLLTEPDHLALLLGTVGLLGVLAYRAWRARKQGQATAQRNKDHHDAR